MVDKTKLSKKGKEVELFKTTRRRKKEKAKRKKIDKPGEQEGK